MTRVRTQWDGRTNTIHLGYSQTYFGTPFHYYGSAPGGKITVDSLHRKWRLADGRRLYLEGGGFDSKLMEVRHHLSTSYALNKGGVYQYTGQFMNGYFGSNPTLPSSWWSDSTSLTAMGTKGIAKFAPGKPVVNLGQFLLELKDIPRIPGIFKNGLPNLGRIRDKITSGKQLGKEYLNYEFGWKPFVKDLLSIIKAQDALHKALVQLRRDNGKVVRRRGTISRSSNSTYLDISGSNRLYPGLVSGLYYGSTPENFRGYLLTTDTQKYWFSGAFRYWIPDIMKQPEPNLTTVAKLLGLNPSPSLLWEVLPYTWLADWFGNIGDILYNLSANAANNRVLLYGYAMGNASTVQYAYSQSRLYDGSWASASVTKRFHHKRRMAASPFGFGLNMSDLTTRQTAILAALGISKRSYG